MRAPTPPPPSLPPFCVAEGCRRPCSPADKRQKLKAKPPSVHKSNNAKPRLDTPAAPAPAATAGATVTRYKTWREAFDAGALKSAPPGFETPLTKEEIAAEAEAEAEAAAKAAEEAAAVKAAEDAKAADEKALAEEAEAAAAKAKAEPAADAEAPAAAADAKAAPAAAPAAPAPKKEAGKVRITVYPTLQAALDAGVVPVPNSMQPVGRRLLM